MHTLTRVVRIRPFVKLACGARVVRDTQQKVNSAALAPLLLETSHRATYSHRRSWPSDRWRRPPRPAQAPTQPGAQSQAPTAAGEIRGKVVDAKSDTPIARASVSLRPKGATAIVAGAIAGPDGAFRIQGLRPGPYSLRATFIGFAPVVQDVTILAASPVTDVSIIKLSQIAVALSALSVTEERDAVTIEPDRNSYRAKDVAPAATNASQVLDHVPSVTVDGDGKVSLRGNENVAIQINGRPAPIRGTQLGAYLKSLPANVVDRVEVVPNPSAKYDPEGMAGIINIVLKQNVDLGISGGVTVGAATAQVATTARATSAIRADRARPSRTSASSTTTATSIGINDRLRYDAIGTLLSSTDQDIVGTQRNRGQNFNTNVDYKLNDARRPVQRALAQPSRRHATTRCNAYSELNGVRHAARHATSARATTESKGWMLDYTLALKRTFEPRKHELSAELRFNRSHDEDVTSLWRQPSASSSVDASSTASSDDNDALTQAAHRAGRLHARRSAAHQARDGVQGQRALARPRLSSSRRTRSATGTWAPSNLSNAFDFNEQVHAAYAVLSQGVGKFDPQGGLRGEYASRDFSSRRDESYPYDYTSFFPSGVRCYNLTPRPRRRSSYSRRIRRPGTQELNPFPSFFDVQNVFFGNPTLNPEYTDAYELGCTKSGEVRHRSSCRRSIGTRRTSSASIINTDDTVDGREVTSISFKNLATSNSWGTDSTARSGSARSSTASPAATSSSSSPMAARRVGRRHGRGDVVGRVNGTSDVTPTLDAPGAPTCIARR